MGPGMLTLLNYFCRRNWKLFFAEVGGHKLMTA